MRDKLVCCYDEIAVVYFGTLPWLQPDVGLVYNDGFNARELNSLQRLVEDHRDELERAWHDDFA